VGDRAVPRTTNCGKVNKLADRPVRDCRPGASFGEPGGVAASPRSGAHAGERGDLPRSDRRRPRLGRRCRGVRVERRSRRRNVQGHLRAEAPEKRNHRRLPRQRPRCFHGCSEAHRFSFDTSDLGKTRGARFVVTEATSGRIVDSAPDAGRPPWTFHLVKKKLVELSAAGFTIRPSAPAAGRRLVAALRVRAAAPIDLLTRMDVPSCKARVAGRPLAPLRASLFKLRGAAEVTARCTWRVPRGTSGELLRASVAVAYEGRALTRGISSRIR